MGFLFRKRIKILPGFWFNMSKSGISTSIGGKGLTVNLKDGKATTRASIPGTGLSYRTTSTGKPDEAGNGIPVWVWILIVVFIVVVLVVKLRS